MLQSAQQTNKFDLNYYVIHYQGFRKAYIILHNLQNTNLLILPTEASPGNLITDY